MATQTMSKKRKSDEGTTPTSKKVKMAKSAEKPAPLKSALKKPPIETSENIKITKPSNGTKNATKTKKKFVNGETTQHTEEKTIIDNDEEEINDNNTAELTADQTAALLAGFSSSEDEREASDDESGVAISSLPKPPTTGLIQKRIKQALTPTTSTTQEEAENPETTPGVVYISRIPHGFFEPQMKAYFSQFGEILRLRLARNKKTGASQHYAFVEFASAGVADIVAKTMDKYLLFGHLLQVSRVPRERVPEGLFKGGMRRKKPAPRNRLEGRKLRLGATRDVWEKRVEMERVRRGKKEEKLREMGYQFEMPGVKSVSEVPVREKVGAEGNVDLAGVDDGGVAVSETADPAVVEEVVEKVPNVEEEPAGTSVITERTTKKRSASGKVHTKKTAKKVKT